MATSPVPPRPLWQTVTSEASTGYMPSLWVPRTLSRPLISAFAVSRPRVTVRSPSRSLV